MAGLHVHVMGPSEMPAGDEDSEYLRLRVKLDRNTSTVCT